MSNADEERVLEMASERALQQAQAEGLTFLKADTQSGYAFVTVEPGRPHPYRVKVTRKGAQVPLGHFTTVEEAALCVARSPEGQAAAKPALPPDAPPTREEVLQQAQAEGLTLRKADTLSGYANVANAVNGRPDPWRARFIRGGMQIHLGYFATAEEAALAVARSPEGRVPAKCGPYALCGGGVAGQREPLGEAPQWPSSVARGRRSATRDAMLAEEEVELEMKAEAEAVAAVAAAAAAEAFGKRRRGEVGDEEVQRRESKGAAAEGAASECCCF